MHVIRILTTHKFKAGSCSDVAGLRGHAMGCTTLMSAGVLSWSLCFRPSGGKALTAGYALERVPVILRIITVAAVFSSRG